MTLAIIKNCDPNGIPTPDSTIEIHNDIEDTPITGPHPLPTERPDGGTLPVARITWMLHLLGYRIDPDGPQWHSLGAGHIVAHIRKLPREIQYAHFTMGLANGNEECNGCDSQGAPSWIEGGDAIWTHPDKHVTKDSYCTPCILRLQNEQIRHNEDRTKIEELQKLVAQLSQERNQALEIITEATNDLNDYEQVIIDAAMKDDGLVGLLGFARGKDGLCEDIFGLTPEQLDEVEKNLGISPTQINADYREIAGEDQ